MVSKVSNATLWTFLAFFISQILRLFSNLILTRLLLPEMFGLMAIVTVVRVGVYMCTEIGLKINIIRHDEAEKSHVLNTAWTMQIVRGILLWILISIIAVCLILLNNYGVISPGTLYADSRLPYLLLVIGCVAFIVGFESPNSWLAQRNMQLGRLTILELLSQIVGLFVMVSGAWAYHSIWALVAGGVVSALLKTVLSHVVLIGRRSYFCWHKATVIEFLHFGKWLFFSAMITFFALNGDRVILGGLLTAEQLGFYAVAYFLATSLKDLVEKLIGNVWYPLLSKVQRDDKGLLVNVYYSLRRKLDIIIYLCVGFLYVTAPLIIGLLYDNRYQDSGWMLQILSITMLASGFRLGNVLLLAMGNPKVGALSVFIRACALIIMLPLAYENYGIVGAIWSIAINPLFEIPIILYFFIKYKIISWGKEFIFLPFVIVGFYMGEAFLYAFDYLRIYFI